MLPFSIRWVPYTVLFGCALLLLPCTGWAQRVTAPVDSTESVIRYTGSATMHNWTGVSRDVSGRLVLDTETPDRSRVRVEAAVASFDSGKDRRDRKMREVTEADRFPTVSYNVTDIRPQYWGRSSDGHAGKWAVTGDLTFHGETHPVDATVDVRVTDDSVLADAQFPISLTRFDVERPELMWVAPIGDTIRIDAHIVGVIESKMARAPEVRDHPPSATGSDHGPSSLLRTLSSGLPMADGTTRTRDGGPAVDRAGPPPSTSALGLTHLAPNKCARETRVGSSRHSSQARPVPTSSAQ